MTEALHKQLRVRCTIERAFTTFTQQIDLWWPPGHRPRGAARIVLEGRCGGRFFAQTDDEQIELGEVLRWEPPRYLQYTWRPGALTKPTLVEVRFTQEGAQTLVEVLHSEGESALGERWPERVLIFTRAWESVLAAFGEFLRDEDEDAGS